MPGLSPSDVVNVSVTLAPIAIPQSNFGALCIIGPTEGVIDTTQRIRVYTTIGGVSADFGTTAPEYLAANLFFSQSPQPAILYIGRWAQSATHAFLHGATLAATAQNVSTIWNVITNGSLSINIDGTVRNLSALNFAAASNMNGVAAIIQAALPAGALCTWNSVYSRFDVRGIVTGASASIGFATPLGSGTDISSLTGLSAASGASAPVNGIVGETPLAAVSALAGVSGAWYGAMFAPTLVTDITDAQYTAVAGFVESANPPRVLGITTQAPAVIDPTQSGDLASVLQSLGYNHTFIQFSSSSLYAVASLYGRAFTVNFSANNSTITLKFKLEPGVVAETLTETQAVAVTTKNCNVFVNYSNGIAIVQQGVMCGGWYIDERIGLDWLQNDMQVQVFNVLYLSPTKIPQTDAGVNVLVAAVIDACQDGANNGLIAGGQWNGPGFGQIVTGQQLPTGYYVYVPPISTQSASARAARQAPVMQVAVKLAGAIHSANVIINVNR